MTRGQKLVLLLIAVMAGLSAATLFVTNIHIGGFEREGMRLGLDLRGGIHLVYVADIPNPTDDQMAGVADKIERRVNALGVAEPVIQRMGSDRILVQLPGLQDPEEAKRLVGDTAQLAFKERVCDATGQNCVDSDLNLTGADLSRAYAGQDPQYGTPVVYFDLKSRGTEIFAEVTTRIAGDPTKSIAIFLDDEELIAPTVRSPILTGSGYIEGGDFTIERVRTIAIQLNEGALPIPLTLEQSREVAATLGQSSLEKSVTAGFIGFVVLAAFMMLYYRLPGVVATAALAIYVGIVLAIFKMVPVTLTLAGIAAFILSVGMAVDANVLIFERMKEELRSGRTLGAAIEAGFSRAWPSIRDSNVATFIICAILYWFGDRLGASPVVGFAVTLFIGVAVSMFSAITITRSFLRLVAQRRLVRSRIGWFLPGAEPGLGVPRVGSPTAGDPSTSPTLSDSARSRSSGRGS